MARMRKNPQQSIKPPVKLEYLTSWKEIAEYMRAGVRTIQRYEREMGLPVRRPTGKSRGAVMATKAELDAWIRATPLQKTFALSRANVDSRALANTEGLRRGLAQMLNLRQQMNELRQENRAAINLLINKVSDLRTIIPSSRANGFEPLVGMFPFPTKRARTSGKHSSRKPQ